MPKHGNLLEVETVLPTLPVNTFQTTGGTTDTTRRALPEIGFSDLRAISVMNLRHDIVGFFDFSKAKLYLGSAKLTIDTRRIESVFVNLCLKSSF